MSVQLGLQLYSVRNELQKDPIGTLEKVAKMGYRNLELALHYSDAAGAGGYSVYGLEAPALKTQMDRLGLKALNAQLFPIDNVNWDRLIPFCQAIGMPAVSISMSMFKDRREALDFSATLNRCGELCRRNGLDFYYHNHFQEFQRFEGEYVMDIILANTDKEFVKIEFDTYWALRGGVDPSAYLRVLGNRCDLVHQKDLPASVQPVNWFDYFGADAYISLDKKLGTSSTEQFTEIGNGIMDIASIVRTVKEMDIVKYIFVEQDFSAIGQLASAKINYDAMRSMLKA